LGLFSGTRFSNWKNLLLYPIEREQNGKENWNQFAAGVGGVGDTGSGLSPAYACFTHFGCSFHLFLTVPISGIAGFPR
jgi:hypothetical protein